jgi:hypothetical protein
MRMTVTVPDKEKIYANSLTVSKTWKNKLELSNQLYLKFIPNKLRETIETLLEGPITTEPVVILGGFTGQYSWGLKEAGANVLHTDLCDSFVALGRKLGLKSMKAHAENPPKFDNTLFYTSFEFAPIHTSASSEVLMLLQTLTNSKYGFIETSLWDSTLTWDHLKKAYDFKSTIWRAPVAMDHLGYNTDAYVVRYYADENYKDSLRNDLKVIDAINEVHKENMDFHELAARIQVTNKKLRESLERINAAMHIRQFNEITKSTIKEIEIM